MRSLYDIKFDEKLVMNIAKLNLGLYIYEIFKDWIILKDFSNPYIHTWLITGVGLIIFAKLYFKKKKE